MKSNPMLDRKIAEATDPAQLRQILVNEYERAGIVSHERGDERNFTVSQHAPASVPAPELPSRDNFSQTASRVVYPHGNLRIELSGVSEEYLDAIEERIRQAFEQR